MQKILVRAVFAGVTIGSAAIIGLATPAAADEPCTLVVVCPPANPAPPDAPAPAPQPPAQQPPSAQPDRPEQPAPRSSADVTADLFTMLDQERSSRGLPLFTRRGDIDGVAAAWSDHLADAGGLSHNDAYFSDGSRRQHGGRALGENVAEDSEAQPAHQHLMASPHHRDNILDARFTVVGLGATYRDGSWWITEDFLQPVAAAPSQDVARSIGAPAPPTKGMAAPAPAADVEAATETADSPSWLVTAPGASDGEKSSSLTLPTSHEGVPAPAAGMALAGLCGIAGILVRRRALTLATW